MKVLQAHLKGIPFSCHHSSCPERLLSGFQVVAPGTNGTDPTTVDVVGFFSGAVENPWPMTQNAWHKTHGRRRFYFWIFVPHKTHGRWPGAECTFACVTIFQREWVKEPAARWQMAMGQSPVPPVNIPIPTKIDENEWCTYPKRVPLVFTHGQSPEQMVA